MTRQRDSAAEERLQKSVGKRVYAIERADEDNVYVYGFGVLEGLYPVPGFPLPNPCIELDDDKGTVWGYQCWWAEEEGWQAFRAGRKVVFVDVPKSPEVIVLPKKPPKPPPPEQDPAT